MAGCAYSSLQLHSETDKKSTVDLFEERDSRSGKSWHNGGDDRGDIKLSLRAHFTSRPVDVDVDVDEEAEALSSSSSSLSSLLSPTVLGSLVTELVLYTEGAFIDRSGLRLKLKASRQGAYVERCVWQPKVRAKVSTAGERKRKDKDKDKEKDKDITSSRYEPFSSLVEAGQNLLLSLVVRAKSRLKSDLRPNKIESAVSSRDLPAPARGASVSRETNTAPLDNAFDLSGFTVQSRRVYRIMPQLRLGDLLYTDRAHLVWFYLPAILRYAQGNNKTQHTTLHYTTLYYTTLHYTILHFTTLHYTTLHYTILHYTTLYYTTLHYTILHFTTLHYNTCGIVHHTHSSLGTPD